MAIQKKRIVVGKLGLDSHDNGIRIIAKWLMDRGYEVIYAGLYNSPERMVEMAVQEDADGIGLSFLGGEHLFYTEAVSHRLKEREMDHIRVIVGGVIPPHDVSQLTKVGAHAVFTPGTRRQQILERVAEIMNAMA